MNMMRSQHFRRMLYRYTRYRLRCLQSMKPDKTRKIVNENFSMSNQIALQSNENVQSIMNTIGVALECKSVSKECQMLNEWITPTEVEKNK